MLDLQAHLCQPCCVVPQRSPCPCRRRGDDLGRSIRTLRWRYADWGVPDGEELYDLEADPAEHTNLARVSGNEQVLERLRQRLARRSAAASGSPH